MAIFDWGDSSIGHPLWSWIKALGVERHRGLDTEILAAAYLAAWMTVAPEERLRAALRVAVPVGTFAYALQYRRQLDFMPAEARLAYEAYMPEQLRLLSARLASA